MNINGECVNFAQMNNPTLYTSAYLVAGIQGYTKHYYAGSERVSSAIGLGGLANIKTPLSIDSSESWERKSGSLRNEMRRTIIECLEHQYRTTKSLVFLHGMTTPTAGTMDRYFYHPDHLGSSSWITDGSGNATQHLHYLPFGEDWVDQRNASWSAPYTFSGKEKDVETGYGYFGARYYDSGLSIWLSVDPMSDKYPSLTPYNYCANNPVILVDPDGREIEGDYYDENGEWMANDGIDDNRVYQANPEGNITFGVGVLKQTQFDYVGDVNEVRMEFTGDMVKNSEKAEGQLKIIQVVGEKEFVKDSYDAISGSRTLYSLENGDYESNNFRLRTIPSMVKKGKDFSIGFSIDLIPKFKTGRSKLRIHPDGPPPGTEGCIGLTGGKAALESFIRNVKPIYDKGLSIDVKVNINNNPNHSQPKRR